MIEKKLVDLGLSLPVASRAVGSYVGFKTVGNLVFVSGQIPSREGRPVYTGKLGDEVTLEDAYAAAQLCALNVLAQLREAVNGDWRRIVQIVRVGGFVNCAPRFPDIPKVVDGASDLLVKVFGNDAGHARAAVGVASLPANVTVEIEAIFEIKI